MRHIRYPLAAALSVLFVLGAASPASAHTGFESSDPAGGATVDQPVAAITLVFTGDAEPTGDGFQVLGPDGQLREPDEATTADGQTWQLRFDPPIAGGSVGVKWVVKAPDAHPIDGSFTFTVTASGAAADAPSAATGGVVASPAEPDPDPEPAVAGSSNVDLEGFLDTSGDPTSTPRRVGAVARFVTLVGTLVGVGALVFAAAVLRGDPRDVRHVLHWVRRAGVLVVVGASAELIAQVAVEGSGDWWASASPSTLGSVVGSSFGLAVVLRVVGGLALVSGARLDITDASDARDPVVALRELVGVGAGPSRADRRSATPTTEPYVHRGDHAWFPTVDSAGAMIGSVLLLAAHLFDGHTVTKGDRLWTTLAAAVHVAGGAVWAGGVLMLATVLWRRHRQRRKLRALQLAVRFSVVATLALVAVGIAGLVLAVIVLDSVSELWATEWGRTLIVKTLLVGAAATAGAYNHKVLIPQMDRTPADERLMHRFRAVVTVEAAALLAVLIATALLMGAAS